MAHEIAKLLLEKAGTFLERSEAIKAALTLGMPLSEIEAYLDWKESLNGRRRPQSSTLRIAPDSGSRPPDGILHERDTASADPPERTDPCSTAPRESS